MTTTSRGSEELRELVRVHVADLHRLAAMLTGGEGPATVLTARTLVDHDPRTRTSASPDRLETDRLKAALVRNHIRSAPRRPEGVLTTGGDAGDVLHRLRPRARAAAALQLVEGWDAERTAAAIGVSRNKVGTLVPSVPGLDLALVAVADQHTLTGSELEEAVLDAMPAGGGSRSRLRGRGPVVAAVLVVALAAGLVLAEDRDDEGSQGDDAGRSETMTTIGTTDLTEAGWGLTDDGDPPRSVNGVHLRETVTLDKGRRSTSVSLPSAPSFVFASFGVLWCDMPPAEDDHLAVPSGTLTVDGVEITLPCAGREGSPPVTQVVALPPSGEGLLQLSGDLPGSGVATLGIYQETDSSLVPFPQGNLTGGPPVQDGEVELDVSAGEPSMYGTWHSVESVSVSHGSTIRVWAGRTGSVMVNVDGVPATDDGDVLAMMTAWTAGTEEPSGAAQGMMPDPQEYADWSTQQVDVRDGRWLVPVPDMTRTFNLPTQLTPGPGERRTVTVEVTTEYVDDHLQVVVTDAVPASVDTAPVAPLAAPDAPLLVTGHRLVGQWEVPSDGHLRELTLNGSGPLPEETVILALRAPESVSWVSWGEGRVSRGGEVAPLWLQWSMSEVLQELRQQMFHQQMFWGSSPGQGPLTVAAPPALDHPATTILAYAPVPYEEFDFAAAAVPPDVWPTGTEPTGAHVHSHLGAQDTVETIGPQDLEDGQVTVNVTPIGEVTVQAATEGKGRIRFLVDGQPADGLLSSDGWWSSWTDQAVTAQVTIAYLASPPRPEIELTVVVEDYEDFSLQVLTGGSSG